jgi:hypothetical protein
MVKRKRKMVFVIFARPEQRGPGPGNEFFAEDGTTTQSRQRAARFHSAESAHQFGKQKRIALDGAMRYVAPMYFSEDEL